MTETTEKKSVIYRLIAAFTGAAHNEDVFEKRKPTPEEAKVIMHLQRYAGPVTKVLLKMRDMGHKISGPKLGYHELKGTGSDLYAGTYALALATDTEAGFKKAKNRFFGFQWTVVELGYIYLLPVINEKKQLVGVDYITRGETFIHGANIIKRQLTPDETEIRKALQEVMILWDQFTDKWRTPPPEHKKKKR